MDATAGRQPLPPPTGRLASAQRKAQPHRADNPRRFGCPVCSCQSPRRGRAHPFFPLEATRSCYTSQGSETSERLLHLSPASLFFTSLPEDSPTRRCSHGAADRPGTPPFAPTANFKRRRARGLHRAQPSGQSRAGRSHPFTAVNSLAVRFPRLSLSGCDLLIESVWVRLLVFDSVEVLAVDVGEGCAVAGVVEEQVEHGPDE